MSIIFVKVDTWSIVLRIVLKRFCSSTNMPLLSDHNDSLVSHIELYSLYIEEASVMPLYERGSLGSVILDFGIGFMILLLHKLGTRSLLKQPLIKAPKALK